MKPLVLVVIAGVVGLVAFADAGAVVAAEPPADGAGVAADRTRAGLGQRQQRIHGLDGMTRDAQGRYRVRGKVSGTGSLPDGDIVFEGEVAPGQSPGCINGVNLSFTASATLIIEIGGKEPCTEHDRFSASGTLDPGGARLELRLIRDFEPAAGDSFRILDWNTLAGEFATIDIMRATLPAGLAWNTERLLVDGTVAVAAIVATPAAVPIPLAAMAGLGCGLSLVAARRSARKSGTLNRGQ